VDDQNSPQPLVSIVVPFFDTYAEFLPSCIESVRHQTYSHWDLIVVDDASPTDAALRIVEQFGDSRLRVIRHQANRGQAAGRNTGIRNSNGPLIMPLDCDDALAPTHIEKLVASLLAHPECGAAYADYRLFGAVEGELRFPLQDTKFLLREQWIPHPGTIVRRSLWARAGGYCEAPEFRAGNEDWDYFLSLAESGLVATRVPEPLYHYRQHQRSITSRQFACADYRMREMMYLRHRELFDRFGMRRPFLAGGYRTSGKAFWVMGERARAAVLMLRAISLAPLDFASGSWRALRRVGSPRRLAVVRS
jgi:glycosyltransferase involved in cell wall biosynthesis